MSKVKMKLVAEEVELDGITVSRAISKLTELGEDYSMDSILDVTTEYDYGEERAVIILNYKRPFTEAELAAIQAAEDSRKAMRRARYKELAKEFGGEVK